MIIMEFNINIKTPVLETDRLILRPLKLDDAEHIYKNWSSDAQAVKYH
jgi:ribosomal-protein-alanine N-acetyltransferase